ncbi:MAG: carboxypeptidase Q [Saprospiraceae bacterium]|jgi:carboxypeptidase Q
MLNIRLLFPVIIVLTLLGVPVQGQDDTDARFLKEIHDQVLSEGECYNWLYHLSENIGGRLAGSPASDLAIQYTNKILSTIADTVYLQECEVPYWERGKQESVQIIYTDRKALEIGGLALGNSVGSGPQGVTGKIIEVQSLDEVRSLGKENIKGNIVFYNRPMDPTKIRTFHAYGGAGDQRVNGPAVAAEYGAIATVVRSVTLQLDDTPHTGVTIYKEGIPKIPAVAISTIDANHLSEMLATDSGIQLRIETHSQVVEAARTSYNVVAEIKGSTHPEEIILVGGHLDSWDVGGGAHDDGAGCVHSMQVLASLKALNYTPKRTIRCVLFMNEENGLGGGLAYAKASNKANEYHMAAIESDAGGFSPNGFSCDGEEEVFANFYRQVTAWEPLLNPYMLQLNTGGSGADISPLKSQGGILVGLRPDSQRYFDYHHTAKDRIEAVHKRELELGAAAMTSLVYLLDKHGLKK